MYVTVAASRGASSADCDSRKKKKSQLIYLSMILSFRFQFNLSFVSHPVDRRLARSSAIDDVVLHLSAPIPSFSFSHCTSLSLSLFLLFSGIDILLDNWPSEAAAISSSSSSKGAALVRNPRAFKQVIETRTRDTRVDGNSIPSYNSTARGNAIVSVGNTINIFDAPSVLT